MIIAYHLIVFTNTYYETKYVYINYVLLYFYELFVFQAIFRLSRGTLSGEILNLSQRKLDQQAKNEISEKIRTDLIAMKDDINLLHHDIYESKRNIATHHERLKKMENIHIPTNVRRK